MSGKISWNGLVEWSQLAMQNFKIIKVILWSFVFGHPTGDRRWRELVSSWFLYKLFAHLWSNKLFFEVKLCIKSHVNYATKLLVRCAHWWICMDKHAHIPLWAILLIVVHGWGWLSIHLILLLIIVRGMMYYRRALMLQSFLEKRPLAGMLRKFIVKTIHWKEQCNKPVFLCCSG